MTTRKPPKTISNILLKNIFKKFSNENDSVSVLKNLSIQFSKNHSYAIIGPSGIGKSTLLHIIAGLDAPSDGEVLINESLLNDSEKNILFSKRLGIVFQYPYLLQELSIEENIMLKGLIQEMPHSECKKRSDQLLHMIGLPSYAKESPSILSAGQKQRVALARALFLQPDFLIADEPTAHLDTQTSKEIMHLLLNFTKEWGMGLILTSHNSSTYNALETVYQLVDGTLEKQ